MFWSGYRGSNPRLNLGKVSYYLYTISAKIFNVCIGFEPMFPTTRRLPKPLEEHTLHSVGVSAPIEHSDLLFHLPAETVQQYKQQNLVDHVGIEPTDNCLQSNQEPQLNHSPIKWSLK